MNTPIRLKLGQFVVCSSWVTDQNPTRVANTRPGSDFRGLARVDPDPSATSIHDQKHLYAQAFMRARDDGR